MRASSPWWCLAFVAVLSNATDRLSTAWRTDCSATSCRACRTSPSDLRTYHHLHVIHAIQSQTLQLNRSRWVAGSDGPKKSCIRYGVQMPHGKGQCWGKSCPVIKYRDFLTWAVQKWLKRSICRMGCGLGLAEGSTSSIVFARWRKCAHMERHIGPTWRIRFNRSSAAAMRSYVKLLWPLVIINKSSALAEMGDRLATIDMGRKVGRGCCGGGWVTTGSPSNTMWPGPMTTSLPSGILIHPTIWPQL